jgi:hypothetical protein
MLFSRQFISVIVGLLYSADHSQHRWLLSLALLWCPDFLAAALNRGWVPSICPLNFAVLTTLSLCPLQEWMPLAQWLYSLPSWLPHAALDTLWVLLSLASLCCPDDSPGSQPVLDRTWLPISQWLAFTVLPTPSFGAWKDVSDPLSLTFLAILTSPLLCACISLSCQLPFPVLGREWLPFTH